MFSTIFECIVCGVGYGGAFWIGISIGFVAGAVVSSLAVINEPCECECNGSGEQVGAGKASAKESREEHVAETVDWVSDFRRTHQRV